MFENKEDKWGKKLLNNEELDLDTCDLDKLKELREKLLERKDELKKQIIG